MSIVTSKTAAPSQDCRLCPRLAEFRDTNATKHPDYFNSPVPSFGENNPWLLIVGLAPGLHGANATGRPFTGDYAGDLLYDTLIKNNLATGQYKKSPDDGLELVGCRITNAVRCVPPENKPTSSEIKTCLPFLNQEVKHTSSIKVMIALGTIAHNAILTCFNEKKSAHKFGHNAVHQLASGVTLVDSYHCSRYNTNTKRLTPEMFQNAFLTAMSYR